ncbi:MAG: type VI secretion system baseplate subunit TssF [Proteobacteria bacterium]|nr:type VI secretion system baseplate subunit TssF [Pseudomonadota bacterium]
MNLDFFKREKSYLRKIAHEFALKFPKVAGHLNLGAHDSGDPQVERLIESFAFLTGNIQQTIEGEFPEVSTALLGILYPNLVNPVPSMSIARFDIIPGDIPVGADAVIPRHSKLFAETTSGLNCSFRTTYPVDLVPIDVDYAGLESVDRFSFLDKMANVGSVIRIRIKPRGDLSFEDFDLNIVRFYLNGDPMIVSTLYETLFCNTVKIAILPEGQEEPVYLPDDSITPVGFQEGEEVIPLGANSHPSYGLIQEYFCFPEKYHFIDINNIDFKESEKEFDLLLVLDNSPKLDVTENTFVPNCAPIINLFEKNSGTIELDHKKLEYHLVPDPDEEDSLEVHSVLKVTKATADDDEEKDVEPFYTFGHRLTNGDSQCYWYLKRKESWRKGVQGTEVFMSFRDLNYGDTQPQSERVYVKTLCTNRDLAEKLPAGALLELEEKGVIQQAICLKKPTSPVTPPLRGPTLWRLISNLTLNYLSLSENNQALSACRSILRTYNFTDSATIEQQIMGLRSMVCEKTLHHSGFEGWRGFCKGLAVTLTVDPSYYAGSSAYLFASVLRKFFSMYVSVNSFVETILVRTTQEGIWKRWTPMKGKRATL